MFFDDLFFKLSITRFHLFPRPPSFLGFLSTSQWLSPAFCYQVSPTPIDTMLVICSSEVALTSSKLGGQEKA
jgi:hypothetical protein